MTSDLAVELFRNAMLAGIKLCGPLLMVALIVGLVIGVLQAATQINEASISFVAKLIAIGATVLILGSWTLRQMVDYTARTFSSISEVVR